MRSNTQIATIAGGKQKKAGDPGGKNNKEEEGISIEKVANHQISTPNYFLYNLFTHICDTKARRA